MGLGGHCHPADSPEFFWNFVALFLNFDDGCFVDDGCFLVLAGQRTLMSFTNLDFS